MKFKCDNDVLKALKAAEIAISTKREIPISYLFRDRKNPNMIGYLTKNQRERFLKNSSSYFAATDLEYCVQSALKSFATFARPSRVIKKLLPKISNKKLIKFSALYKLRDGKFEVRSDVTNVYNESPVHSCMSGCDMSFYELNGIKVLTFTVDKVIVGRAVYYPEIKFPHLDKTLPLMVCPYTKDGRDEFSFDKYARKNGIVIAKGETKFEYDKKEFYDNVCFKLKTINVGYWPYFDIMCYVFRGAESKSYYLNNHGKGYCINEAEGQDPFEWHENYRDDYDEDDHW